MKRILSLMPLLLCAVVGVWADSYVPLGVKTITDYTVVYSTEITAAGNPATDWVVVPSYGTSGTKYTNTNGDSKGNPNAIEDAIETTSDNVDMIQIKKDGNTFTSQKRVVHMHVTGISGVIAHGATTSSNRGITIACTEYVDGLETMDETSHTASVIRSSNSGSFIAQVTGLDANKEYIVSFYAAGGDSRFYCAEFIAGEVVAVDPVFSLDKASIGLDETAQIIVGSKSGLDGLTMSDLTYDNTVISIDETGKITPVAQGTSAITFTTAAIDGKYNAGTANLSITVTAPVVATPVITPADGSKFYTESQVVTATCETEDAVLSYSTDNEATWTALPEEGVTITETTTIIVKAEKDGYVASKATATITKVDVVLVEQTDVTDDATWDWSVLAGDGKELIDAIKNEDVLFANIPQYGIETGSNENFNAQALLVNCQYAWRNANDSKFLQGNKVQFNTTVSGTVTVEYANTGNNAARTVVVNDAAGEKSSTANNSYQSESFDVSAGSVTITGKEVETGAAKMLRIRKVEFKKKDTTGIQNVEAKNPVSGETYNLNGQRVAAPVKGLYIVNGRKVVVK